MTVRSGGSYVADPKTGEETLKERTDVREPVEPAIAEDGDGAGRAGETGRGARRKPPSEE